MRSLLLAACFALAATGPVLAWNGTDLETGAEIEIESGNLVREGHDIEIYDWDTGEYRDVTVEDMRSAPGGVEVEVYDWDTGEYRTFEMED